MVFPIGPVRAGMPDTLIGILKGRRLTGNLRLCLDAGDADSYSSGRKWLDTSGNGHDFFFGSNADSQTVDPAFNGVAGGKSASEYMSTDGTDYFQYDSANEDWMSNIHKNNARFSVGIAYYNPASKLLNDSLFGTSGPAWVNRGITYELNGSGKPRVLVGNGSASILNISAATAPGTSAWHFLGMSIDEPAGAGGGFHYLDGNYNQVSGSDTFNAAYSIPSTGNAAARMDLLGNGGGASGRVARSGTRLAMVFFIEGAVLSKADFDNIYADIKAARSGFNLP